jgi:AraC-like DNA-binding protein
MRHLPSAARSVRSTLADAVASRLHAEEEGSGPGRASEEAAHHGRLRMLFERDGAAGVIDCGREFAMSTSDPLVEFLGTSQGPLQLAHRYRRVEPMFHLGHRTETTVAESSMTFRHVARLGTPPEVHDTLLLCGTTIGMFLRIGVSDLRVEVLDSRGAPHRLWPPPQRTRRVATASAPLSWTVSWDGSGRWSGALTAPTYEHLRALIAATPERSWDLRTASSAIAMSPRTLQRRLHADRTTVGRTIVAGRLDAAVTLLARTSLDVTTIALACGFADLPHLTRHFRGRFGEPPGRHRAGAGRDA